MIAVSLEMSDEPVICGVEGITDCKTKGSRITVVPFVESHLRTIGYHRISGSLE